VIGSFRHAIFKQKTDRDMQFAQAICGRSQDNSQASKVFNGLRREFSHNIHGTAFARGLSTVNATKSVAVKHPDKRLI